MAGFDGLIRNFDEQFIRGFHDNIDYSNIFHVEILALMHEFQTCWEEGLRHIICYIDFMHTIHLVHHVDVFPHHYENEIVVIKKYMVKD